MADKEIRLFDPDGPVYREMSPEKIQKAMEDYQSGLQRFTLVEGLKLTHIPTAFMDWWDEHKQDMVNFLVDVRKNFTLIWTREELDKCDKLLLTLREIYPELFPPDPQPIIVMGNCVPHGFVESEVPIFDMTIKMEDK